MDYKYKISVVVPIYNTESYLRETLESIEHQTIGIENIQIILINDGSTDNSESICLEFMEKYPHNVVYRAIENGGVSRARNYGKQFMQGKYVNFFDSDDIWDTDAFFKAYNMLEKHEDIDVVAVRLKYFEASKKYHWLDYKFTGDRIIDINSEPQNIVIHMSTCLIRSEVMRNLHYDENLKVSEDTKLLYQIILQKEKYGIISSSKYNYRKRKEGNSAIQVTRENKYWYLDSFPHCHDYLINMSRERYGEVIPYVQHFIMYEIQWRLRAKILDSLTDDEKEYYVNKIKEYIMITDDDIIMFQKNISLPYKIQALKVKYGDTLYKKLFYGDDGIYINQTKILSYENITNNVELSHVEAGQLIIEGHFFPIEEKNELYYCIGNKYIKIDLFDRANNYNNFFGDDFQVKKKGYRVVIPLKDVRSIEIAAKFADNYITLKNRFIHFSRINNYSEGYYYEEKYLITKSDDKRTLYIDYRPFVLKVVLKELRFLAYIFFRKKKTKVAIQRALYWLSFPFFKNVWIFADREFLASDSAEVLFKYINNKKDDVPKKTYFALRKDSVDFKRVGKYGKTVDYHSLKYKLLFLHAKFLISSRLA